MGKCERLHTFAPEINAVASLQAEVAMERDMAA